MLISSERDIGTERKERSRLSKEEWREYTRTVWHIPNVRHAEHPAVFPVEIPRRLIKLFSFWGEKVLDPFAGIGTTAEAALDLGRDVVCVEQNESYVGHIRALETPATRASLRVVHGDSSDLSFLDDESVDLVVTSPPYWNKADYGTGNSNVGGISSYHRFFQSIRPMFQECARVLRRGRKMCVVTANVNQHTDLGLLAFPLAADFTWLLRGLGLALVSEIVWCKDGTGGRWGSANGQRPIFGSYPYPPNFLFKTVHEHILVFVRPASRQAKGPKVVRYSDTVGSFGAWCPLEDKPGRPGLVPQSAEPGFMGSRRSRSPVQVRQGGFRSNPSEG